MRSILILFSFFVIQSAHAKPIKIKGNCVLTKIDNQLSVQVCKQGKEDSKNFTQDYILSFKKNEKNVLDAKMKMSIETDDPDSFIINPISKKLIGVEYDGHECTNFLVFDLEKKQNIFDTGCWQPFYFSYSHRDPKEECLVYLSCTEGCSEGKPEKINVCGSKRVLDIKDFRDHLGKNKVFTGTQDRSNSAIQVK